MTRWSATSAETTTVTARAFAPPGPLEDSYTGGEGQALTVEVGTWDKHGNVSWQQVGPVYLDSPQTPDYAPLEAYDWQESGCTLMGVDRRLYRNGLSDEPQELFATWDKTAVRLAWSGASWHIGNGDLFVYLDTGPGGTKQLYIPIELPVIGAEVGLPATMEADAVLWVQTPEQATLLRWDGGAWTDAELLTADQLHFGAGQFGAQLDMYLPFDLLGLSPESSLGLIGLAVQEPAEGEAMQLWATLPPFNPVNSPSVSRLIGLMTGTIKFDLLREYRWPALGDGACPNGVEASYISGREGDTDLQLSLTSDPEGTVFSRQNSLFWITDPGEVISELDGDQAVRLLEPRNAPVVDGQALHYRLEYHNRGDRHAGRGLRRVAGPRPDQPVDDKSGPGRHTAGRYGRREFEAVAEPRPGPPAVRSRSGRALRRVARP